MGIIAFLESLFKEKQETEKEQYQKQKKDIAETAVSDTVFWDKNENIDKKELNKRKKFLKLLLDAQKLVDISYKQDKQENIEQVITALHFGKPEYYKKENICKLRNCRLIEGQIQLLYSTVQQATNSFMQILYLDILDDSLMDVKTTIAPSIYKWAFQEDLPVEKFENIFIFNAESLSKQLHFRKPITPQEAWGIILEYKINIEKE